MWRSLSAFSLLAACHGPRDVALSYRAERMKVILSQAAQMPKGGILVIGDSIAERVWMPELCGKPVLNAGIGRATSKEWLPDARKVIEAYRPSIIVLELGTNDHGKYRQEY